jgi:hypothetical protein
MLERLGELGLERGEELSAGGNRNVRRTRTTDQDDTRARALVPEPIIRLLSSVRIGQVPVMAKPARITASRKVSQPVLAVPFSPWLSACLKA